MYEDYWDGENWLTTILSYGFRLYYLNDIKHREDGPAEIWYDKDGSIEKISYYKNGKFHRKNGPASIYYYKNGYLTQKEYFFNGKRHREDGPSFIRYYRNNSIEKKEYWFNNIKFDPDDLPFELPIDTKEKQFLFNLKYGDNNEI